GDGARRRARARARVGAPQGAAAERALRDLTLLRADALTGEDAAGGGTNRCRAPRGRRRGDPDARRAPRAARPPRGPRRRAAARGAGPRDPRAPTAVRGATRPAGLSRGAAALGRRRSRAAARLARRPRRAAP